MGREPALFLDFRAVSSYLSILQRSQVWSSFSENKVLLAPRGIVWVKQ